MEVGQRYVVHCWQVTGDLQIHFPKEELTCICFIVLSNLVTKCFNSNFNPMLCFPQSEFLWYLLIYSYFRFFFPTLISWNILIFLYLVSNHQSAWILGIPWDYLLLDCIPWLMKDLSLPSLFLSYFDYLLLFTHILWNQLWPGSGVSLSKDSLTLSFDVLCWEGLRDRMWDKRARRHWSMIRDSYLTGWRS